MRSEIELTLRGQPWLVLAGKALYWPQRKTLCIADPHFGKAAAYRAMGQPVPHGTTADNLSRLDTILARYPATHLIFLGDFLHAPESHATPTLAMIQAWRDRHRLLRCTLVRGNHDRKAGDPPSNLRLDPVDEPLILDQFAFRHKPSTESRHHVIAGHIHPVFHWRGRGHQSLRLPCFQISTNLTILPAFGDFTGGQRVPLSVSAQIIITDGNHLWALRSSAKD